MEGLWNHHSSPFLVRRSAPRVLVLLGSLRAATMFDRVSPVAAFPPCHTLHEGWCGSNAWWTSAHTFPQAFALYAPIHFLPALIFRWKKLRTVNGAMEVLSHGVVGTLKSTLFLTLYTGVFSGTLCLLRNLRRRDDPLNPLLAGFICALSVLLEKKNRRSELAVYCVPRVLEILYGAGSRRRMWSYVPYGEVVLFMVAMSIIMYCYQNEPKNIKATYRDLLVRFFGKC